MWIQGEMFYSFAFNVFSLHSPIPVKTTARGIWKLITSLLKVFNMNTTNLSLVTRQVFRSMWGIFTLGKILLIMFVMDWSFWFCGICQSGFLLVRLDVYPWTRSFGSQYLSLYSSDLRQPWYLSSWWSLGYFRAYSRFAHSLWERPFFPHSIMIFLPIPLFY